MPDHDAWAKGLNNETLAAGVRSLATKLPARDRTDEILALIREAARRIEAASNPTSEAPEMLWEHRYEGTTVWFGLSTDEERAEKESSLTTYDSRITIEWRQVPNPNFRSADKADSVKLPTDESYCWMVPFSDALPRLVTPRANPEFWEQPADLLFDTVQEANDWRTEEIGAATDDGDQNEIAYIETWVLCKRHVTPVYEGEATDAS